MSKSFLSDIHVRFIRTLTTYPPTRSPLLSLFFS
jgi:hypothetical protein